MVLAANRPPCGSGSNGPAADSAQELGEADPRRDAEFAVAGGEMDFDGLGGHEQGLSDVAVGLALGREPGHPALAGGEGIHAGAADTPGTCPGRRELVDGLLSHRGGAEADGQVEPRAQRLAGLGAVGGPAQGSAELHEGAGVLEPHLGLGEEAGRLGEGVDVPGELSERAQGDSAGRPAR